MSSFSTYDRANGKFNWLRIVALVLFILSLIYYVLITIDYAIFLIDALSSGSIIPNISMTVDGVLYLVDILIIILLIISLVKKTPNYNLILIAGIAKIVDLYISILSSIVLYVINIFTDSYTYIRLNYTNMILTFIYSLAFIALVFATIVIRRNNVIKYKKLLTYLFIPVSVACGIEAIYKLINFISRSVGITLNFINVLTITYQSLLFLTFDFAIIALSLHISFFFKNFESENENALSSDENSEIIES